MEHIDVSGMVNWRQDQMTNLIYNPRKDSKIFPVIFVTIWSVAQLAVFWFEWYRLLVFANVALLLFLILTNIYQKSAVAINWQLYISFLSIYAYFILASTWAPIPADANEQVLKVLAAALPAFFAGDFLARNYKINSIIYALCFVPLFYFLQSSYNLYFNGDVSIIGEFSIRSVGGAALTIMMPTCLAFYLVERKIFYLISFFLCLILIFVFQSRTGILVGFSVMFLTVYIFNKKLAYKSVLLVVPALAFLIVLFPDQLFSRLLSSDTDFNIGGTVLNELGVDRSLRVDFDRRLHTYMANRMFFDAPIFGGGYYALFQNNRYEFGIDVGAHGYPGTFAETGLIGMVLFANYLRLTWKSAKLYMLNRYDSFTNAGGVVMLIAFTGVLGVGFFHQLFESPFCALLAGILVGASSPIRKGMSPKDPVQLPASRMNI